MKRIIVNVSVAFVLIAAGCTTSNPTSVSEAERTFETYEVAVGSVIRVNPSYGYVVVKCASLPSLGEEATVYQDREAKGRLRINGPMRVPFVIADVLDGSVSTGDTVRVARKRSASAPGREEGK